MKKTNKILALVMAVAMIFGVMSVLPVVGSADDEWFTGSYVGLAMSNGNVYVSDGFGQWAYGGDPAVSYNPYVVYGDAVTANAIKVTVDTMPSSNLTENATVYVDLDQWANGQFVPWSLDNATAVAATIEIDGNTLIYKFAAEATGKTFCVVWGDGTSEDDGGQITFSTTNVKAGLLATSVAGLTVPTVINGSDVDDFSAVDFDGITSWTQKSGGDFSGIRNGQIEIECGTTYNEGTATLPSSVDVDGYDGLMFHIDLSEPTWGVNADPEYTKCYVGVRIYTEGITGYVWTRDTNKLADGSYLNYDIDAYYSADGSDWSKTSLVYDASHTLDKSTGDGERFNFPAGFVGWIYIPFTSYNTTKIDNGENKYPVLGFYNTNVTKFMVLTGGYSNSGAGDKKIVVDSFGFVKLETPAAPVSELRLSYADADADDKIDAFYLNAVVKADVTDTVGIIFSDTEDSCVFGSALFSRTCTKYDALMQSRCYGETVITAENLGGEEGDKIISVHWLDLPTDNLGSGSTLYARTFIKSADGTITYQDVVSFTLVEGTSSNSIV